VRQRTLAAVASIAGLRRPPRLRADQEGRRATWLELFFDLVFVVAVAELSGVLHGDLSWHGLGTFLGVSAPVIWTWMNFTFYADQFDTDDVVYRLAMFAAMLASIALAAMLDEHGTGFVLAYVALKVILCGLYGRSWAAGTTALERRFSRACVAAYAAGGAVWLASLALPDDLRPWAWALGLAIEIGTPIFGPKVFSEMPLSREHIPERFGLFTIIVFGETIVVVALAGAEAGWPTADALAAVAGFALACGVWWLYFDRVDENRLRQTIRPNLTFIYAHPLLFASLNALAVGVELAIEHASGHALEVAQRALLGGGTAAVVAMIAAIQGATDRPPPRRVQGGRLAVAAVAATLIAVPLPALALTGVLAALVAAQAAYEALAGASS
jgi:low temperature requirement protein LtrA